MSGLSDGTGEQAEWLKNQREEKEQQALSVPLSKQRYMICKTCSEFNSEVKVCKQCYCFMPAKTMLSNSTCPLGRW